MRRLSDARGSALLSAIVILGMMSALAAAYAMNVRSGLALRGAAGVERSGFYVAEAGLNVGVTRFANIFRESGIPDTADFQQTLDMGIETASITLMPVSGCTPCAATIIPQGELFAGLHSLPYRYTVESRAFNKAGESEAKVAGQFDIHSIPIFQFLGFINDNLYIMPLLDATLHGRIHTNKDLYLQPDNNLKVEDLRPGIPDVQVTATGKIYRGGRKYNSTWNCGGTVVIDKLQDTVSPFNDLDPKTMSCGSSSPLTEATLAGWKGSIKQGMHNIVTPGPPIINRGAEYWENAEMRIVLDLSQRASIDFGAAGLCPGGPGTTLVSPSLPLIQVVETSGAQNVDKTTALRRFMCERRGAIFFTDIPTNAPTPPNGNSAYVLNAANYIPVFTNNNRVYRRVGEDTNGDGSITSKDYNWDICPVLTAVAPWWRPTSCPASNAAPIVTSWFNDMDYRRGGFWNHREQQWMYLLNINVRALIEWNAQNGDPLFPRNDTTLGGLVFYFSMNGPDANAAQNNYGIRVFDSADLDTRNVTFPTGVADPTGLTIVSDQGMIIEGNYNSKDKQPAAILSDAQWILSQGWEVPMPSTLAGSPNDLKSVFDLDTNRRDVASADWPAGGGGATSFTGSTVLSINAALLFGLGQSTLNPSWYNGGLENFPRFLESWTGFTLNYRGSFVSLGDAQHKKADWACGSGDSCYGSGVYDPPVRNYDFDADFNTVEKLPPQTPKIVYVQQLLYTRIYN